MEAKALSKTLLDIPELIYISLHKKLSLSQERHHSAIGYISRCITDQISIFNTNFTIFFEESSCIIRSRKTDFTEFKIFSAIDDEKYKSSTPITSGLWTYPLYSIKATGTFNGYSEEQLIEDKEFFITCTRMPELNPRDVRFGICVYLDDKLDKMIKSGVYEKKISIINRIS